MAFSDCLLAAWFLLAAMPGARVFTFSLAGAANVVWIIGAGTMAAMSLARYAPRSTNVNIGTLVAAGGMMILPIFMRPTDASSGALATTGLILELLGVALTQVARVYMGRSFGILPANRGIVWKGPFQWIRHPIYFGWLLLSIGYAMSYANERNVLLIAGTLVFMVWRIDQEEAHLRTDPEYRSYMDRVRFRLFPGLL